MLDELTPLDWAVNTLLANSSVAAYVGDRIDEEDNVPPVAPNQVLSTYFPRVVYSGQPHGTGYAEGFDLGWGDYTFKVLMREDALPPGETSLKAYTSRAAQALENALSGVADYLAAGTSEDGVERPVHGCEMIDLHTPPLYGPDGRRMCERGRVVRLVWS